MKLRRINYGALSVIGGVVFTILVMSVSFAATDFSAAPTRLPTLTPLPTPLSTSRAPITPTPVPGTITLREGQSVVFVRKDSGHLIVFRYPVGIAPGQAPFLWVNHNFTPTGKETGEYDLRPSSFSLPGYMMGIEEFQLTLNVDRSISIAPPDNWKLEEK